MGGCGARKPCAQLLAPVLPGCDTGEGLGQRGQARGEQAFCVQPTPGAAGWWGEGTPGFPTPPCGQSSREAALLLPMSR